MSRRFDKKLGNMGCINETVYQPKKIKEEENKQWGVMGKDPDTVGQLVSFQRKTVVRQLQLKSQTTRRQGNWEHPTRHCGGNIMCTMAERWIDLRGVVSFM